jgi:phage baseplate assembly protein W
MALGMNVLTGTSVEGLPHLKQSIKDILTTRIGTRVMRRDYGCDLLELIDQPITPAFKVRAFAAIARALRRWEPRFRLTKIAMTDISPGKVTVEMQGVYLVSGKPVTLDGITIG